jgi:hypothetical protein
MPDDLLPLDSLPNLSEALAELAERERTGEPTYAVGCCLLVRDGPGLGGPLTQYIKLNFTWLDLLTGDDCVVFIPCGRSVSRRPEGSMAVGVRLSGDDVDRVLVATARHLDVSLDSIPCAVLFLPSHGHTERLVLRLADYVPRRPGGYDEGDVDAAMHALVEAIRRAAREPSSTRLTRLRDELVQAHARAFDSGPDASAASVEWPGAVSASASVLGALASAAAVLLGVAHGGG